MSLWIRGRIAQRTCEILVVAEVKTYHGAERGGSGEDECGSRESLLVEDL